MIINPILVANSKRLYIIYIYARYNEPSLLKGVMTHPKKSGVDPATEAQLLDSRGEAASGLLPGILSLGWIFFFGKFLPKSREGGILGSNHFRFFW